MAKNDRPAGLVRLVLCAIGFSCLAVAAADYLAGLRLRAHPPRRGARSAKSNGERAARPHDGTASNAGFRMGVKTTFDVIDVVRELVLEALEHPTEEIETRASQSDGNATNGRNGDEPA